MADLRPVGVFDSGLGGLTVVRHIRRLLPNEDIIYFGDTARVPYGTRSAGVIEKYATEDEEFLLKKGVKTVVAACGTVSSVAANTGLRLPVPFLDVVRPAAQAAVEATKNGRIGVIGTTATVQSGAFEMRIKSIAPKADVFCRACSLFVPIVEAGWVGENDAVAIAAAQRYLTPLRELNVDTLIMGCTHFPVIKHIIRDIMGESTVLIDPGEWVAKALQRQLAGNNSESTGEGSLKIYITDRTPSFPAVAKLLLGCEAEILTETAGTD